MHLTSPHLSRYIYLAPWHYCEGTIKAHGRVLRIDTAGDAGAAFSLRYCDLGHNGGLCAALPGPRFLVSTQECGVVAASAHRAPPKPAGPLQHVAGVFDGAGQRIRLYIDGECVADEQIDRPCRMSACSAPLAIGSLRPPAEADTSQPGSFLGEVLKWKVDAAARSADEMRALAAQALSSGELTD